MDKLSIAYSPVGVEVKTFVDKKHVTLRQLRPVKSSMGKNVVTTGQGYTEILPGDLVSLGMIQRMK